MKGIIYLATNTVNDKKYVGQTINSLRRRKNHHCVAARNQIDKLYFHRAIRKYGESVFEWTVLETVAADDRAELANKLNQLEIQYIRLHKSNDPKHGYNLTAGGEAYTEMAKDFWNDPSKSGEHRKELSGRMSSYWADVENRKKHKEWMDDFYNTPEGRQQAAKHSSFMKYYYNGPNSRENKAKTSKWFVKATSPEN